MSEGITVVGGGFGNSHAYTEPFTNHLAAVLGGNVEQFTLAELHKKPLEERFSISDMKKMRYVAYSGSSERMPPFANEIITLCGVEPLNPAHAILRALRSARNLPPEYERGITLVESLQEIVCNPEHLRLLGRIANFSTFTQLKCRALRYPGGRYYIAAENDEFGFGDQHTIDSALRNGISAEYFGIGHNFQMKNPEKTANRIYELLEAGMTRDNYERAS